MPLFVRLYETIHQYGSIRTKYKEYIRYKLTEFNTNKTEHICREMNNVHMHNITHFFTSKLLH